MTETGERPASTEKAPMGRGLRALLIGSLALNLAVLGVVGGGMIAGRGMPHPFGGFDMTLGPFAEALDGPDRDALRDRLRGREDLRPPRRGDRDAALTAFLAAIQSDPFDSAAVQAIFADQRTRATAGLAAGQDALMERLTAMTPEARSAFADRLARRLGRMDH